MPSIRLTRQEAEYVSLHYEDQGLGDPVVLLAGFPLPGAMWEGQVAALVEAGHRVVTYDRRGFGRSSRPWDGYDFDTFADDLAEVLEQLDLVGVTLVGFSMAGGEIARFFSRHGDDRVRRAVLSGATTPDLWRSADNPAGPADEDLRRAYVQGLTEDRPAFLQEFLTTFFTAGPPAPDNLPQVSQARLNHFLTLTLDASPRATTQTVQAVLTTDFRDDLAAWVAPTLIIHGDADAVVPYEASAVLTTQSLPSSTLRTFAGGGHALPITHREEWNDALLEFLHPCVSG